MEIIYFVILLFTVILSKIINHCLGINLAVLVFVISNSWFFYIINSIIERKRCKKETRVSLNGLFGARAFALVFEILCMLYLLSPTMHMKIYWFFVFVLGVVLVKVRMKLKKYLTQNNYNLTNQITNIGMVLFVTSVFACLTQILPQLRIIDDAELEFLTIIGLTILFCLEQLAMPRNSILARISTKLYRSNPMIDEGNELVD